MKYVIVSDSTGLEIPIIFPNVAQHIEMVPAGVNVIAAGECGLYSGEEGTYPKASCWGQSYSLRVKSRGKEDEALINKAIENY